MPGTQGAKRPSSFRRGRPRGRVPGAVLCGAVQTGRSNKEPQWSGRPRAGGVDRDAAESTLRLLVEGALATGTTAAIR